VAQLAQDSGIKMRQLEGQDVLPTLCRAAF
jgi:hypothetical protein